MRSKTFKIVMVLLLLASAAAVILPQLLAGGVTTYTLATVGRAPASLVAALDAAQVKGDFTVEYLARGGVEEVRAAVQAGDATVGLADEILYVAAGDAGTFPVVVAQAVVRLEVADRLTRAGLTPRQVADLQSVQPPKQVTVAPVADEKRAAVGFAVGISLYMALLFGGSAIATAVAQEKASRISEVLLVVLRPSQILAGTVLAVGTVTLAEILVLATPVLVAIGVRDDLGLPAVAAGDIALGLAWFVIGFGLYAFLYAACGALVNKVTEVSSAVMPIVMIMLAAYMVSITVTTHDPTSPWSLVIAVFPLTSPIGMPFLWASGEASPLLLLFSMMLAILSAAGVISLASTVYRRGLLITGRRVGVREVIARHRD
ncbi:ABC transporter permease [Terrabacter sp. MAHUQ-38]|uniref:ABC transporter permease n=1 Tax=unclassified Terrabacter TaxID=2630222 RepID=UPI00165E5181|nr:ABC transporter permease [Terrabacter sp. MAHUQ-38]